MSHALGDTYDFLLEVKKEWPVGNGLVQLIKGLKSETERLESRKSIVGARGCKYERRFKIWRFCFAYEPQRKSMKVKALNTQVDKINSCYQSASALAIFHDGHMDSHGGRNGGYTLAEKLWLLPNLPANNREQP